MALPSTDLNLASSIRRAGSKLAQRRRRLSPLESRRRRTGILFVLPAFLTVLCFFFLPLVFAVYVSLTDWPLVGDFHFIGPTNYAKLAQDSIFGQSILFTLKYTAIVTPSVFIAGYGLALLVRGQVRWIGLFRTIYFLPVVVGLATVSFMLLLELQPESGAVDLVLSKLHLASDNTAWLLDPNLALLGTSMLVVWSASGLIMIVLLSGMQGIPTELYDAARVDGARRAHLEWYITLPLLRNSIALSLILAVVGSFLAFNQFLILTQGGPGLSTVTIVLWIYEVAFVQFHLGYATAMSMVLLVMALAVSTLQFVLLRSPTE